MEFGKCWRYGNHRRGAGQRQTRHRLFLTGPHQHRLQGEITDRRWYAILLSM